ILSSSTVAILLAVLTDEQFMTWAWRIPFLLSIVMMVLGLFIRLKVMESPVFSALKKEKSEVKMPFFEVFGKHPKSLLIRTGLHSDDAGIGVLISVFIISYVTRKIVDCNSFVINMELISNLFYLMATPLSGFLPDKFARRPVYERGTILMVVFA